MKVLFFCNLVPLKTGAFEALLAAIGRAFVRTGDEFVVVLAGDPIAPVAETWHQAGVRWHVLPGWVEQGTVDRGRWTVDGGPWTVNGGRESEGGGYRDEVRSTSMRKDDRSGCGPAADVGLGGVATAERVHPWRFVVPALRFIRHERPDVVVVHFGNELPTLVASMLSRLVLRPRPAWVWQQDQQIRDPGRLGRRVSRIRLLAAGIDRFVVVYDGGKRSLCLRGVAADRVVVIPNSVAAPGSRRPRGWLRRELAVDASCAVLVATGSLVARKRQEFVLRACAQLPVRTRQDWVLVLAGDGPERARLESLARELGLLTKVRFLGLRNDVCDILGEADVLVHAAVAEASSYAVLESMVAGIPAVLTDAGAAREQVAHGESGFVLARDDLEGFAAALARLVLDRQLSAVMGRAAKARWEVRHHLERAAAAFHTLYSGLAAKR